MENSTTQGEKREKIVSIMEQMEKLSRIMDSAESLVQNMIDKNIADYLPVELQNIHPTLTECHILQTITKNGSMTGSQLAKSHSMTPGGMTKALAKLLEKGLVSKELYSNNLKEIYYSLTSSGKQIVDIHEIFHKEILERITVVVAECDYSELYIFETILTKIMKLLADNFEFFKGSDM
ncbi:MarR family winged helix-turn-helix transcriptional regulator [Clostridium beijerinckii]|uniref:MarR family winged helix-turn-helix transcriptional regulator n=1 Tax=Clostridium beijerinckii TaxID=1520 RepID=UPI000809F2A2|nr:MarR family transcriptional regulator [Clostridium beijerinckii]OCA96517.1 hypothetical protein BGS1_06665 [Clostridium beijerinckii]